MSPFQCCGSWVLLPRVSLRQLEGREDLGLDGGARFAGHRAHQGPHLAASVPLRGEAQRDAPVGRTAHRDAAQAEPCSGSAHGRRHLTSSGPVPISAGLPPSLAGSSRHPTSRASAPLGAAQSGALQHLGSAKEKLLLRISKRPLLHGRQPMWSGRWGSNPRHSAWEAGVAGASASGHAGTYGSM